LEGIVKIQPLVLPNITKWKTSVNTILMTINGFMTFS